MSPTSNLLRSWLSRYNHFCGKNDKREFELEKLYLQKYWKVNDSTSCSVQTAEFRHQPAVYTRTPGAGLGLEFYIIPPATWHDTPTAQAPERYSRSSGLKAYLRTLRISNNNLYKHCYISPRFLIELLNIDVLC